jgi:hypothetical protein
MMTIFKPYKAKIALYGQTVEKQLRQ